MELSLPIALPARLRLPWRLALALLLGATLLGGGWVWLRDSSLVAVRQVRIGGVRGPQAAQIEALLRAAARRMTTLDFDANALRTAVGDFPVVKQLEVSTGFPHGVRIRVIERPPVATLLAGGQRTALAADGTALGEQLVSGALPLLRGSFAPIPGQRVGDAGLLAAVAILGAAPSQLARFVARVYSGSEGLTVEMRNGLLVYFGDPTRPHAKWLALARVLSDPGSMGARYVDVRVPERPAAGGSGTSLTAPQGSATSPQAALAERLQQGVGGGSASASSGGESSASGGESSESSAATPSSGGESSTSSGASSGARASEPHVAESSGGTGESPPSSQATGGASPAEGKG